MSSVKSNPINLEIDALHQQSLEARKVGNYGLALQINESAIKIFDANAGQLDPFVRYSLFTAKTVYLLEDGRPEEALSSIKVALAYAETIQGEKANRKEVSLCLYHIGRCLGEGNELLKGIEYVQKALAITDNPLERHRRKIRIGEFYAKAGEIKGAVDSLNESVKELQAFYQEILKLDPASEDIDNFYEKMDKKTLLVKILDEVAVAFTRLADALLRDFQPTLAIEALKKAVSVTKFIDPQRHPTQNNGRSRPFLRRRRSNWE